MHLISNTQKSLVKKHGMEHDFDLYQTLEALLMKVAEALATSLSGLSVNLIKLYTKPPNIAPKIGPTIYIQIVVYLCMTKAGPIVLTGFIEPPEIGLHQ